MDTIAFLTLLLGLTLGPQNIRMSAADNVNKIELRLDGAAVAVMTAPPWQADIDLGNTLAPHRLTAVAFDASGSEVGTVEQKINLPRATAEARAWSTGSRRNTTRRACRSRRTDATSRSSPLRPTVSFKCSGCRSPAERRSR